MPRPSAADIERDIARKLIGSRKAPPAVARILAAELEDGETIAAAISAPNGQSALIATNRRALIASKRKVVYEWSYDAITQAAPKNRLFKADIRIMANDRAHKYPVGSNKAAAREMAETLTALIAESDIRAENEPNAPAPPPQGPEAAYIGFPTPSRIELREIEYALNPSESVSLIANCRIDNDYGVIAATTERIMTALTRKRGVDSISYRSVSDAALSPAKPLNHILLNTTNGLVRIDALDPEAAPQICDYIQSRARARGARPVQDDSPRVGAEDPLSLRLRAIDDLYKDNIINAQERLDMIAKTRANRG